MEELAINGGPKTKTTPYNRPNRYGKEEIEQLQDAIHHGHLMYTSGEKVREFEDAVCGRFGCSHCVMTTSGTAALHAALAALGVAEGGEVITVPMCDAGMFIAILAQHAVPVFADVLPGAPLIDPASVEQRLTEKTKVIVVVHMAGIVADMTPFLEISAKHGIPLLEDCSQCHGGTWHGQYVGTIGHVGAYSMNESKHMSTGDGGFVTTNNAETAKWLRLFIDKAYKRDPGVPRGREQIDFMAMNYRPNCLSAAVGLAQLGKLGRSLERRRAIAQRYFESLGSLPHLRFPAVPADTEPAWWPVPVYYTGSQPGRPGIAAALQAEGVWVDTGMSPANNIMDTRLFREKHYYPLTGAVPAFWREAHYDASTCPNVNTLQSQVIRLPVDHRFTDEDIEETIEGYRKVWTNYFGAT